MPMRFLCCWLRFLISIPALLSCMLAAADTVIIDNVVSNDPNIWYFVGNSTPTNWLIVTNAGALTVSNATIGSEATATGNTALITGTGSAWTNSNWLIVGSNGSCNTLIITNGGLVVSSNACIGFSSTANSNRVFISGTGSVWSNTASAFQALVGLEGSWNQMQILNGGRFYHNGQIAVGYTNGANNSLVISGTGSLFYGKSYVYMGYTATAKTNWIRIENGGQFQSDSHLYIGFHALSNQVRVTGSNSLLSVSGGNAIIMSYDGGRDNQLIVESNAQVNAASVVGGWYGTKASVLVDGAGSRLVCDGATFGISIGYGSDSQDTMVIRNGGYASGINNIIGMTNDSFNNQVTVTDAGSVWSNRSLRIGCNGNYGNGLIISNGGIVKIGTNLNIDVGFVTNYFTGRSSGLDLVATNGSINVSTGKIHIVFASKPATNGFYWGLRWAGNHTNELNSLNTAGKLTWDDSILRNPFYTSPVSVLYDSSTTNTYVGWWFYLTQGIHCTIR